MVRAESQAERPAAARPGRDVDAVRPTRLAYMVRRQGEVVMIGSSNGSGDALTAEMWLAPGSYELVTREREPVTTAPFRVLEQPGPRLRIELR